MEDEQATMQDYCRNDPGGWTHHLKRALTVTVKRSIVAVKNIVQVDLIGQ